MSNTNNQLANLKEQYEQARLLEEHAYWSLDTPRTWEDILFGDNKAAIAADADKWHETARRIAMQMKTLPGGWDAVDQVNDDVARYMKQRKAADK